VVREYIESVEFDRFGDYRFITFNSSNELQQYVKDKDYGFSERKPGVCFGFQINNRSLGSYELELFFNDQYPESTRGVPY
jgi:hypothetical protein